MYEKASEVLLHQWDVEAKLLEDPRLKRYAVELDFRDKQVMLRQVACLMQASDKGLAGNFIRREDLAACLTDYLETRKKAQNAPSIAVVMIDQLRERNFILCALGGDAYGFVHRTFLEYFCASEIVERFGRRGLPGGLSFDDLRDQVFGQHWQDETWHEVLRLITGMIDAEFVGDLIKWLLQQPVNRFEFLTEESVGEARQQKPGLINLLLAADCYGEVRTRPAITPIESQLLNCLQAEVEQEYPYRFTADTAEAMVSAIASHWQDNPDIRHWLKQQIGRLSPDSSDLLGWFNRSYIPEAAVRAIVGTWFNDPETLPWLKQRAQSDQDNYVRGAAVEALARGYKEDPETLPWLKQRAQSDQDSAVRRAAVAALARGYKEDPETLPWLKQRAQSDQAEYVRRAAVEALARGYREDPETLPILKQRAQSDEDSDVRRAAVEALAWGYKEDPETLPILKQRAQSDQDSAVRHAAVEALARGYKEDVTVFEVLQSIATTDPFQRESPWDSNPRQIALSALLTDHPNHAHILELLHDRAYNDPDEALREWAHQRLATMNDQEG